MTMFDVMKQYQERGRHNDRQKKITVQLRQEKEDRLELPRLEWRRLPAPACLSIWTKSGKPCKKQAFHRDYVNGRGSFAVCAWHSRRPGGGYYPHDSGKTTLQNIGRAAWTSKMKRGGRKRRRFAAAAVLRSKQLSPDVIARIVALAEAV